MQLAASKEENLANSRYYYNQYTQNKKQSSSLKKDIDYLTNCRNKLMNDFYDEQNRVNQNLNALMDDLRKAVRHDSAWDASVTQMENKKETVVTSDYRLNTAQDFLQAEINTLNKKKNKTDAISNTAYQNYQRKKDEERKAILNTFKNIF